MGIRGGSSIRLGRTISLGPITAPVIERLEYEPFTDVDAAEGWALDNLAPEVDYSGLLVNEANLVNRVIAEELNRLPLAPVKLRGIRVLSFRKNPFDPFLRGNPGALAAIEAINRGISNEYSLLINADEVETLVNERGGEYYQATTPRKIADLEKAKEKYESKWKEFERRWLDDEFQCFKPGDLLFNYEDYRSRLEAIDRDRKSVEALAKSGVRRWGAMDYADDLESYLEMTILHEMGHLRHVQLFPGTIAPFETPGSRELSKFMRGSKRFSMYCSMAANDVESFAEHYALYRRLPQVLRKKSPIGYDRFRAQFGE